MTIHRFYVPPDGITRDRVRIAGDAAGQIRRVLRLQPGAVVEVFDGSGRQVRACIIEIGSQEVIAEPVLVTQPETEHPFPLVLIQALLKGEKTDWVVEKATELGASSIVLFPAVRSVVQVREERAERKTARWRRIAQEAAEQCGRVQIPKVSIAASMSDALGHAGEGRLVLIDEASSGGWMPDPGPVAAVVGPEGGWDPSERARSIERGAVPVSLGPRILRAETAAVVALARIAVG